MPIFKGDKRGNLTVVARVWYCRCECGNYCALTERELNRGNQSCGCDAAITSKAVKFVDDEAIVSLDISVYKKLTVLAEYWNLPTVQELLGSIVTRKLALVMGSVLVRFNPPAKSKAGVR